MFGLSGGEGVLGEIVLGRWGCRRYLPVRVIGVGLKKVKIEGGRTVIATRGLGFLVLFACAFESQRSGARMRIGHVRAVLTRI